MSLMLVPNFQENVFIPLLIRGDEKRGAKCFF